MKTAVTPEMLPRFVARRRGGKQPGWVYLNSVGAAKAAVQRVMNLMLVGDPKVLVPRAVQNDKGEPSVLWEPEKLDPKVGYAVRSCIETWVSIHNQDLEKEVDEMREEIEMMRRLLAERGLNFTPSGSRTNS